MHKHSRHSRLNWLLPLAVALPVIAAGAAAIAVWGPTLRDLISIAIKAAVIS